MDTLMTVAFLAILLALLLNALASTWHPTPVIYIETPVPQNDGVGCLLLIIAVVLGLWFLSLGW